MRLLIAEPYESGHRSSYVRWLLEAAVRGGFEPILGGTPPLVNNALIRQFLDQHPSTERVLIEQPRDRGESASTVGILLHELTHYRWFRRLSRAASAAGVDCVVVPYLDYCFHAIAILGSPWGSLPWCGITMRTTVPQADGAAPLRWKLLPSLLRTAGLRAVFTINAKARPFCMEPSRPAAFARLRYVADPAELRYTFPREHARARLGLRPEETAVLAFGTIDDRKGVRELLNGALEVATASTIRVIIAGRQSVQIREFLASTGMRELLAQGRVTCYDQFVDDEMQGVLFSAADVVWLGYRDHEFSSGVMVLAGRAGLPVITGRSGEIAAAAASLGLGLQIDPSNPAEVADALVRMTDANLRREMGARAATAFAQHTPEQFGATVLGVFRE